MVYVFSIIEKDINYKFLTYYLNVKVVMSSLMTLASLNSNNFVTIFSLRELEFYILCPFQRIWLA